MVYSRLWNDKYIHNNYDKDINSGYRSNDILHLILSCFVRADGWNLCNKLSIRIPSIKNRIEFIKQTEEFSVIKKFIPINTPKIYINETIEIITIILYHNIHIISFIGYENYEKNKSYAVPQKTKELLLDILKYVKDATYLKD